MKRLVLALLFPLTAFAQYTPFVGQPGKDVIWVPTPYALAEKMLDMCRVSASKQGGPWLAELDGQAIATGAASIVDGVVLLAGASTIPEARHQGAQQALLEARLRAGAEAGCDLAMMGAAPGSSSQRNAERHGFRIAYTRIKWRLVRPQ